MLIRGTVRDAAGRVLEGAVVVIAAAPVEVPDIAALSGDDGTFAVAVPAPGSYRLEVRAAGHAVREIDVELDEGADVDVIATLGPGTTAAG